MPKSNPKNNQLMISEVQSLVALPTDEPPVIGRGPGDIPQIPTVPTVQAVNQLRNGTFSHSVRSWVNSGSANDARYEAAWWFSHSFQDNAAMSPYTTDTTGAQTFTADHTTEQFTATAHGFSNGLKVQVSTTGTLPAGLTGATTYYIHVLTANTFYLCNSLANAYLGVPQLITDNGSGTHTVTPTNFALKESTHAGYDTTYNDWKLPEGIARLQDNLSTIDAQLPVPTAEPSYTLYAVLNIAARNEYIYARSTDRLACGLYAYQDDVWGYLRGDFDLTGNIIGTVSTNTIRDYKLIVRTNRGFSVGSTLLQYTTAPHDDDFAAGTRVTIEWDRALNYGIDSYDLYRKTEVNFDSADVTAGTDNINLPGHMFNTGDPIVFGTKDTLPPPLVAGTGYYAIRVDDDNFKVATSKVNAEAGTPIDLTGAGSGTGHSVYQTRLLERIETGLRFYIDNGSYLEEDYFDFPTPDFDGSLVAYSRTQPNVLANLPVDGVDDAWDTLPFALKVPNSYQFQNTGLAFFQWVRWGLKNMLSLRITDANGTASSTTITSAAGQFTSGMQFKDVVLVNGKTGETFTSSVAFYNSATSIDLADSLPDAFVDDVMVVTEGAPDYPILIDLVHLSYGADAIFGFHPDDLSSDRGDPVAVPNGGTQGGPTTPNPTDPGGDGTGRQRCVWEDEPITVTDGMGLIFQKKAIDLIPGQDYIFNHRNEILPVRDLTLRGTTLWRVTTKNGFIGHVSDTHKFLTSSKDVRGTQLRNMFRGDDILTCVDGIHRPTTIESIEKLDEVVTVQIHLDRGHLFLHGQWKDGVCRKWGGICAHNKEQRNPDGPPVE